MSIVRALQDLSHALAEAGVSEMHLETHLTPQAWAALNIELASRRVFDPFYPRLGEIPVLFVGSGVGDMIIRPIGVK